MMHTNTEPSRRRTFVRLAAIAIVLVLIGIVLGFKANKFKRPAGGMIVYMTAAQRLVAGEELFIPGDPLGAFTYPAAFALPFVPLLVLPPDAQWAAFTCVNLLLLEFVVVVVWRRVRPYVRRGPRRWNRPWVWCVVVTVLSARHLVSPIEGQTHDLLLFAVLLGGLDAWCVSAPKRAGLLVGVAGALKATPLLFGPYWLWQRQWAAAVVMGAAVAAATLAPDVLYPRPDGQLHAAAWYRTFISNVRIGEPPPDEGWAAWNVLNQNLSDTLYRLTWRVEEPRGSRFDVSVVVLNDRTRKVVTVIAQLMVFALMWWVTRRKWTRALPADQIPMQRFGEGGVVLCAMLLLSPMSSKAHFCALFVAIAFCAVDFFYRRPTVVVGAALLLAGLAAVTTKDIVGRPLGNALIAYGAVMWVTVALLIASGYALVQRSRQFSATDTDCD